jgi:periplasmic divalent cation tolerance protein
LTDREPCSNVAGMQAIVVITTVGTEEQANLIAREIVARRHAACVNILPAIRSIYRWKGKICKDGELLLVVKTLQEEFAAVAATIRELHSYELPEILSFKVSQGDQAFLDWIAGSVDKEADFSDEEDDEIAYAAADPDDTDF